MKFHGPPKTLHVKTFLTIISFSSSFRRIACEVKRTNFDPRNIFVACLSKQHSKMYVFYKKIL